MKPVIQARFHVNRALSDEVFSVVLIVNASFPVGIGP
jgi:hypothetical protein